MFGAYYVDRSLSNFLIINLGTASVITCVINNKLSGVVISPGYHISKHALISHAHLLKNCKMEPINKAVGTTTQEAISIGVANGHILMMKSLVDKIEKFNKFEYKKFITGGNLKELEKGFLNYTQESMLIEKGLVYILENFIAK
ncbi:type III pantothenate kinase [Spiroplasma endosymbiont of Anurida maritima]|uniref:type III pantothenate kinase n=1 Tax=Spiroplasma endosymbiont of Anurida maritima TaxID=2967972 RepID=UPI0036D438AD